jgi:hypothetical protein
MMFYQRTAVIWWKIDRELSFGFFDGVDYLLLRCESLSDGTAARIEAGLQDWDKVLFIVSELWIQILSKDFIGH